MPIFTHVRGDAMSHRRAALPPSVLDVDDQGVDLTLIVVDSATTVNLIKALDQAGLLHCPDTLFPSPARSAVIGVATWSEAAEVAARCAPCLAIRVSSSTGAPEQIVDRIGDPVAIVAAETILEQSCGIGGGRQSTETTRRFTWRGLSFVGRRLCSVAMAPAWLLSAADRTGK